MISANESEDLHRQSSKLKTLCDSTCALDLLKRKDASTEKQEAVSKSL
jgi:hypothetical protein